MRTRTAVWQVTWALVALVSPIAVRCGDTVDAGFHARDCTDHKVSQVKGRVRPRERGLELGIKLGLELGLELGCELGLELGPEIGMELGIKLVLVAINIVYAANMA